MSSYCDGTYDIYQETKRKARKDHKCSACREKIPAGHEYTVIKVAYAGSAKTIKRCGRCQKMHKHLREKCLDAGGNYWPDEELNCGFGYEDEWGKCPEEIQALAFELP